MKKTLSKDYGKLLCTNKILAIVLVFVLLFTQFIPLNVSAATTGAKISNGIDYSGQGTIIDGDIRKEGATVSGNYVNIPVYTYGAYTYNTWDEFWATWSSWSPSNSKYSGYKGYRYAPENKHIVDFESKTEYQYRRWNDELNPVYKTKYITEYEKCTTVLFVNVYTYHTEYSYSGYPGAKSGYTIHSRRTEREIDYYRGGYEYYGEWKDSKPITMPWETSWSAYNSRTTYRVKKIDSTWDPNWKNETTERVPLNYSLYKKDSNTPIGYGIKFTTKLDISEEYDRTAIQKLASPIPFEKQYTITQYYITSDTLMAKITKEIYDNRSADPAVLQWFADNGGKLSWGMIIKAIEKFGSKAVAKTLGNYMAIITVSGTLCDALLEDIKASELNKMFEVANEMDRNNAILVINSCYYVDTSTGGLPMTIMDMASVSNIKTVSCKYNTSLSKQLGFRWTYPADLDYFGVISYISNENELDGIIDDFCRQYDLFDWLSWLPN